ncbi:MAG: glycerol-3-phosphate 1-O-acyltransferase PlsY [Candidatus Marinimicrobia bacterium]|jgi:glycerol-3-phosphate acyltransferase PlsY|nr:glycerol-3-phosphate 1-O-acyltransferase PlsY [Candidatus Neomarinimicrobiota bacterium]MBT3575022.1 glycerol-3-phosphate 1-O-acyltransferase PlsY [Candidatus Neomarinimicrobiota bacterium]MBT3678794.1 glycerol-3-phosphate 1-O-acyltransferase PlsY [Candidatus Neomarinimicrobiota bacterium]MBT3949908.1 glycerol-3-phosphate 1-O-acyltransferase PlsY [Candidatus Neomarinimicrobiota bacterium]MBT4252611.1 glycerol-3-phosphate 1-O-acyltransferase PlsY [Candidatus Neomarinimicrobiota bacterium]
MVELLLLILIAYIVGSTPTSIIVSKLKYKTDIREHGSGNAGATNVFRTFGWKPALFVTIIDVFKGWMPSYIAGHLNSDSILFASNPDALMIIAGFAAVLGHTYTVFAGFKGGKGVGTLAGMLIALFPIALPICLLVFIITLISTGIVSLGSMLAASALPVTLYIIEGINPDVQVSLTLRVFSLLIPLFVIFTHRSNIKRMLDGTENRFEKARIFKKKTGE